MEPIIDNQAIDQSTRHYSYQTINPTISISFITPIDYPLILNLPIYMYHFFEKEFDILGACKVQALIDIISLILHLQL